LQKGVPASILKEVEAVGAKTSSTFQALNAARENLCERCWDIAEKQFSSAPQPSSKPARGRGFSADEADHKKIIDAASKFGEREWTAHLPEICEELHRVQAKVPASIGDVSFNSWREAADKIRETRGMEFTVTLRGYIRYRINRSKKSRRAGFCCKHFLYRLCLMHREIVIVR